MLGKPWLIPLALGLAMTGSAGSTAAPPASPLAECKLNFAAAKARLARLETLEVKDLSSEEGGWLITRYEPSTIRPLGMAAMAFEHEVMEDEFGRDESLYTTVAANFEQVRDAMLAAYGKAQCFQPFAAPNPNECMVAPGNEATGKPGVWVKLRQGKTQIICRY